MFLLGPATAPASPQPFHVLIDPGHGGIDKGAVRGNLKEADIALKVSHKLADILEKDPRFKVSMTRTKDVSVSLPKRTQIANQAKTDVFLSIHINSSTDTRAKGKEFYFQNTLPPDEEALALAARENEAPHEDASDTPDEKDSLSSQSDLKKIFVDLDRNYRIQASSDLSKILHEIWASKGEGRRSTRAIRQAPFYVVSFTDVPSVLVELGFISNPQEGPKLALADYQQELARSLYEGLVKFKETVDKGKPQP